VRAAFEVSRTRPLAADSTEFPSPLLGTTQAL
jgi:hypothetical protein